MYIRYWNQISSLVIHRKDCIINWWEHQSVNQNISLSIDDNIRWKKWIFDVSFVSKVKKLSLGEFNFTALFLNWKIELLASQVNEELNVFLWVNDGSIFFIVIREDLRKHLCFCWNWKSLKALTVLTQFWHSFDTVSILGHYRFHVGIWNNDATLPDAVSA